MIGSRDPERARELALALGVEGGANADVVRDADLVVLSTRSNAALETAKQLAGAIGTTPLLCVASDLTFTADGVVPGRLGRSLAEEMADLVDAPLAAGFQSLAAAHLMQLELPDEDALVCGDDEEVKRLALDLGGRLVAGRAIDAGPLANARALEGDDGGDPEREQALPGPRRPPPHRPAVIELRPVEGLPEIREGDDLAALVAQAADLRDDDVVVIAQKAVSKAEGRVVRLDELEPSPLAREIADDHDPRQVEAVLRESVRIVRRRGGFVIAETRHGFVCASAGVDASNAPEPDSLVLLPLDPDASARGDCGSGSPS